MSNRLARYGLVGLANTAIGYAIILIAMWMGAGDYLANGLGYGLGLTFAYLLHRRFTFAIGWGADIGEAVRFSVTAAVAYCANIAILWAAREAGFVENPLAQLVAMAAYSIAFYVFAKGWVFLLSEHASRSLNP